VIQSSSMILCVCVCVCDVVVVVVVVVEIWAYLTAIIFLLLFKTNRRARR